MPSTRVKPRAKAQRRPPSPPGLMVVDGHRLVLPQGRMKLAAWPEFAFAVLSEPEPDILATWMERIERRMGVTDAHRQAMADRGVAVLESVSDRRRRKCEEALRASRLNAPMRDPRFVEWIEAKLGEIQAARAESEALAGIPGKRQRKAARAAGARVRKLEVELADLRHREALQDQLFGEARDTILTLEAHGHLVHTREAETAEIARDRHGARIINRSGPDRGLPALVYDFGLRAKKLTGIEHAFAAGYLRAVKRCGGEDRLKEIGQDYRYCYEVAEGHTGSNGEGGGGYGAKAPQPRLVEAGQDLADMRKGLDRRQRDVLDAVCGQDMRVREAAAALKAGFPATVRALCQGLKAAAASLADERARREDAGEMAAGLRVQLVSQALRRVRA